MKIRKYVSTRILSGFHKAVVNGQIVKLKVHMLPSPTQFLSGICNEKLKCKNVFLLESYLVYIRQLSTFKLLT